LIRGSCSTPQEIRWELVAGHKQIFGLAQGIVPGARQTAPQLFVPQIKHI